MMKQMGLGGLCALLMVAAPTEMPEFGQMVTAMVVEDALLYNENGGAGGVCGEVKVGETVEIVEDRSCLWYSVAHTVDGRRGWMEAEALEIPRDTEAKQEKLSAAVLEGYVNGRGIASQTGHLLFVDLERQWTYVFVGEAGRWQMLRSLRCATGKNASPTKRGLFACETRGEWFYSERLQSGARYWVRFDGPYLFHSLAMNENGEVIDFTLGERVSSGCVRLAVADARWLYGSVPDGTAVLVE